MIAKRGSLTRQLVTRTAALVTAVAVALSVLITIVANHILTEQLDRQLDAAMALVMQDNLAPGAGSGRQRPGAGPGIPPGTISVRQISAAPDDDGRIRVLAYRVGRGGWNPLDDDVAQRLFDLEPGRDKVTIDLPGIGGYRVAVDQQGGLKSVVGLPLADLARIRNSLIAAEVVLGLAAVIASVIISSALVRRTLRPLTALSDAAREVSGLTLHEGEVDLGVRLDTSQLHPDNEMTQVGNAFNHMLNNVEQAFAVRQRSESKVRQFVADASHELRNPLAAIRGYSELASRHANDLTPDTAFALTRINAESTRMSKLVNDLLLLARLDSTEQLSLQPTDIVELVLNAVSDARAAGPGHTWQLDVPDEPVLVPADPDRLYQVLVNLLSNARTHTPPGTVVHTRVAPGSSDVLVSITDNGPGIPADQQDKVFGRFVRGDEARAHSARESTGLGLAIVSAVVTAHAGDVRLSSRPGQTTLAVRLPRLAQ